MAGVNVDVSELRTLAADLGAAAERSEGQVRRVVAKAALNIKKDLQQESQGSPHFPGIPASITYDTFEGSDGVGAEIGPEIGKRQGSLAFIAYEGNARMGPRFPDPSGALDRETEAFQRYLGEAIVGDLL